MTFRVATPFAQGATKGLLLDLLPRARMTEKSLPGRNHERPS